MHGLYALIWPSVCYNVQQSESEWQCHINTLTLLYTKYCTEGKYWGEGGGGGKARPPHYRTLNLCHLFTVRHASFYSEMCLYVHMWAYSSIHYSRIAFWASDAWHSHQGSDQNILEVVKKVSIFSTFACLHHFSTEKRWLKWLGGGKCRPVLTSVGRTLSHVYKISLLSEKYDQRTCKEVLCKLLGLYSWVAPW